MSSILKPWLADIGLRHQGVVLAALRGCDTAAKEAPSKTLTRWLRDACLNAHCGDSSKSQSFIEAHPTHRVFSGAVAGFMAEKDALPTHYVLHLMHAARIVGRFLPETEQKEDFVWRAWGEINPKKDWQEFYSRLVRKFRLNPETDEQMDQRLNATESDFGAEQRIA